MERGIYIEIDSKTGRNIHSGIGTDTDTGTDSGMSYAINNAMTY